MRRADAGPAGAVGAREPRARGGPAAVLAGHGGRVRSTLLFHHLAICGDVPGAGVPLRGGVQRGVRRSGRSSSRPAGSGAGARVEGGGRDLDPGAGAGDYSGRVAAGRVDPGREAVRVFAGGVCHAAALRDSADGGGTGASAALLLPRLRHLQLQLHRADATTCQTASRAAAPHASAERVRLGRLARSANVREPRHGPQTGLGRPCDWRGACC